MQSAHPWIGITGSNRDQFASESLEHFLCAKSVWMVSCLVLFCILMTVSNAVTCYETQPRCSVILLFWSKCFGLFQGKKSSLSLFGQKVDKFYSNLDG